MGLFDKLFAMLTGARASSPEPMEAPPQPVPAVEQPNAIVSITATITGYSGPSVDVSDAEVSERVREHAFVLTTDPPPLKTGSEWWNEETHKRRRREGSEKAYAWLLPFVPIEVAKHERLQAAQEWGPHGTSGIAKDLRALTRDRRKAKEPHQDLLMALYGACIAADLSSSLPFEGTQPHYMARFVDLDDLRCISIDFGAMGYRCIKALSKTDVKWLVEAFGEPVKHQSVGELWPHVRQNAVARYCWGELRTSNESAKAIGRSQKTMQEWLHETVRRSIGSHKEWQERVGAREAVLAESEATIATALAATRQPFAVADLETTGLDPQASEVLELAAVRVDADGTITGEFSMLVRPSVPVPARITELTGITQSDVDREGRSLADAMRAFTAFLGARPVFFHNAPFDQGFLAQAGARSGVQFTNAVYDTLPLARRAWPSLPNHKLPTVAQHVDVPGDAHRALADSRTALAVLLAARSAVDPRRAPSAA